jgi:serine/threonine-protein kinase
LEALKILPEDVSADPDFRQRFAREADIASSLWHPHIVAVHDRGEYDGQLWIAMDYVEGTDAAQLVRNRFPHGMPPKEALEIVSAIADALDYAHERYLLHRDVKPANILLTDARAGDRRILLADFGIAKAANETKGITATNMTVGSVAYAAPEELTGKALDGRADQYALACTAFHLLTGRQPYASSNPAVVIGNHLSSPPPRLGSVREDLSALDSVLAKGMAKEPHQRFETCREFASALSGDAVWRSSVAETQLAPAPTPPFAYHGGADQPVSYDAETDSKYRRLAMIALGVVALLAVGLVAFVGARLAQPPPAPTPTAQPPIVVPTWQENVDARPPQPQPTHTVTQTVASPPVPTPSPRVPQTPQRPFGDLALPTPMSTPPCNGQRILVLGNVTTPGLYPDGVRRLLNAYPGSSYLRTDQSCPSLRQADDEGDPIYTVYRYAGMSDAEARAAVCAQGGDAYGKRLDYTSEPTHQIRC